MCTLVDVGLYFYHMPMVKEIQPTSCLQNTQGVLGIYAHFMSCIGYPSKIQSKAPPAARKFNEPQPVGTRTPGNQAILTLPETHIFAPEKLMLGR